MTSIITDHITAGQDCLKRLRRADVSPSTQMYASLVQESIAHTLTAIALLLDGQDRPAVPGLPKGYDIQTQQAPDGQHKWRYVLTGPQFAYASRYRWDTSENALGAGIVHARQQEDHRAGMDGSHPLLAAAREAQALNEPVHITQNTNGTEH